MKHICIIVVLSSLVIICQPYPTFGRDAGIVIQQTGSPVNECDTPAADWVFCSDFENGNLDDWTNYSSTDVVIMSDPGPQEQPDNHIVRLRLPPGRGTKDLVKVLPGDYDRIYARWYQKFEPGYDFSTGNHVGGALFGGDRSFLGRSEWRPDGTNFFSSTLDLRSPSAKTAAYTYYRGMYMLCSDPTTGSNPGCYGDNFPCMPPGCKSGHGEQTNPAPIIQDDKWYCMEMTIDAGTPVDSDSQADGILDYWVDGVEIGPWTDLWWRTVPELKANLLWMVLFQHTTHSVAGIMFDNVVVSTSRIGCLGQDVVCTDNDGDNYNIEGGPCGAVDCNDNDASIHPGATDVCDGVSNDCDGEVDEDCIENGITLNSGWNLISLNLQPTATSIVEILSGVPDSCNSAWAFNNNWKAYYPDSPDFSDLDTMEARWGYWLNMNASAVLSVTGIAPSKTVSLNKGWNLVGYNSFAPLSIALAIGSITENCESVWAYINGAWKAYYPTSPEYSDLEVMEPNYGYWIKTKSACNWTLP